MTMRIHRNGGGRVHAIESLRDAVRGLAAYERSGVTDVRVTILSGNDDEHARTRALLRSLA